MHPAGCFAVPVSISGSGDKWQHLSLFSQHNPWQLFSGCAGHSCLHVCACVMNAHHSWKACHQGFFLRQMLFDKVKERQMCLWTNFTNHDCTVLLQIIFLWVNIREYKYILESI